MRLIKPSFQLLTPPEVIYGMQARIEAAGRTCYKSESPMTHDSAAQFVAKIITLGHESVIEHESLSVRIICDRGVTHEIVRHRLASYSQESTRYCDYKGGHVEFIIPPWCTTVEEGVTPMPPHYVEGATHAERVWIAAMFAAEMRYKELREHGWSPQQARAVLPNSLKTEIVMTANLREWRHFFKLRCAKAAHPQMREIATPIWYLFSGLLPTIFMTGGVDYSVEEQA